MEASRQLFECRLHTGKTMSDKQTGTSLNGSAEELRAGNVRLERQNSELKEAR